MFRILALTWVLIALFIDPCKGQGDYLSYGPAFKATMGDIWPKPYQQNDDANYYALDADNFQFVIVNKKCQLLSDAIARYITLIKAAKNGYVQAPSTSTIRTITQIRVNLTNECETVPHLHMDESYHIYIKTNERLVANSVWGILRALESFAQMLVPMPNGKLRLRGTEIYDKPRFKYRGLMLDSARHFISKPKILQLLDGMAYNKLNVFHWHVTDDSAYPFRSNLFPELAEKGAYRGDLTYSVADVQEIVEYARVRGIRVVPEFDTPAHTASWGASHPELMTDCYGKFRGQRGPLNPAKDSTFTFLYQFFSEIKNLFPDQYLHLGVDEVDTACWESNPQIQSYLKAHGLDNSDLSYLYLERFSANISSLGWKQMAWQEAMIENGWMEWPADTIAQLWFDYKANAALLTQRGFPIVRSADWYLYVLDTGADWEKFYNVEPNDFQGTQKQLNLVLGGEACLWSEWLNEHNVVPTTFPRVSAVAERLWSPVGKLNADEAQNRLEEHNCRMLQRGIEARPANGFGMC